MKLRGFIAGTLRKQSNMEKPLSASIWLWIFMYLFFHALNSEVIGGEGGPKFLNSCCSAGFRLENGTCLKIGNENESVLQLQGSDQNFLRIPKHLSMSAYPDALAQLNFSLKSLPNPQKCTNGEFSLKVSLENSTNNVVNFTIEGYLKFGMDYYAPNEYCIDLSESVDEKFFTAIVCNASCSTKNEQNPCIKRCCEFGQVWDLSTMAKGGKLVCASSGEQQWLPVFYSDPYTLSTKEILPHFVSDHPRNGWCNPAMALVLAPTTKYRNETPILIRVEEDGTIVQKIRAATWAPIPQATMCIDGAQNFPGYFDENNPGFYTGDPKDTLVFDCRDRNKAQPTISNLYRYAMIVACIFLLLTVIVYVLLWEEQNVHGWSLLCYITSLFFMYISLCLMHFSRDMKFSLATKSGGGGTFCFIIGVSIHFFFLSSFCWLTVINFDLWWTFRALKPTAGKSKGLKSFLLYAFFALGVPIVIVSVGVGLDFAYRDDIESDIIVPLYARTRCYMEQHKPMLVYVYGPIAVLISLNIIFFLITVFSMYQIQKSTKFASNSSSKVKKHNQSARLFVKLFIIMGVTWSSEVISWALTEEGNVPWYFVIFDLINILQAVLIFVIFVCKKETLHALQQKYPTFRAFVSLITRKPEGNNLSSTKSTGTELSFTDTEVTPTTAGVDRIEMSTNPHYQQ